MSTTTVSVTTVSTTTPAYVPATYCGDGIVQPIEQCDAGGLNGSPGSRCSVTCQVDSLSTCGNGTIQKGEECDDGNTRNGDGCNRLCKIDHPNSRCGDGIVQSAFGEQCDDGNTNPNDDCDAECKWTPLAECGDGFVDAGFEQCDSGQGQNSYAPNAWCRTNCTWQYCGDGVHDDFLEECDDGNNLDGDGCNALCVVERAGAPDFTGDLGSGLTSGDDELIFEQIPTPAQTPTGPGLVIFLASGAAAGVALARRRRRLSK